MTDQMLDWDHFLDNGRKGARPALRMAESRRVESSTHSPVDLWYQIYDIRWG